ncbi:MAG: hypothetical protein MHMPM18_000034 [Marteilia pararefringens]
MASSLSSGSNRSDVARRISSSTLRESAGKRVLILARVQNVRPFTRSFSAKMVKDESVDITVKDPCDIALDGWYEFIGHLDSKLSLICENFTHVPGFLLNDFDENLYDQTCTLLSSHDGYIY